MVLSDMLLFKDNADPSTRLAIAIHDETGRQLGELQCLDKALASETGLVEDLTDWRNAARTSFLTQFEARPDRTATWLRNVVLAAPDRILFIVRSTGGERIGHIGISNVSDEKAEIDNVMRGRRSGERRMMFYSSVALIAWIFETLRVPVTQLCVLSLNTGAIRLYDRLGFEEVERTPLRRIDEPDMTRYTTQADHGSAAGFDYLRMEISAERFRRLYPWAHAAG